VGVTVDKGDEGWTGNVGVVTTLVPKAQFDPENTVAFACGPEIMMRFAIIELLKRGVKKENLYVSMERNMKCGMGMCWHCMFGASYVCKDGPVFRFSDIADIFEIREV
jgi:NAD(P)H-flavin reductase